MFEPAKGWLQPDPKIVSHSKPFSRLHPLARMFFSAAFPALDVSPVQF
jgi:hypothetical protein